MSCLTEKAIGELLDSKFFIPSYQRGYRWSERQIEDLLEDINSFIPTQIAKSDKKTWYCLQPVVIKECDERTKIENGLQGTWYEVIDGQQRLTSIFLIIHYANEIWVGKQEVPEFQIKYETRDKKNGAQQKGSYDFLQKQKINKDDKVEINYSNIDYYHISLAYSTIHNWVKNYKSKYNKEFDNNNFLSKLRFYSKVIWYEIEAEKDAIEIFTRINMGKIPLTNAELIKALFLNSSNFPNSESEEIRLRQLEIASEWDRIEYSLQNEELWYFINNSDNELPTRIEHIFNIIYSIAKEGCVEIKYRKENRLTKKTDINKRIEEGHITFDEKFGVDEYSTFRFFSKKFNSNTKDEIDNNWKEIKRIFQTIEEWFLDRELYHKVGFLISTGTKISDLIKKAKNQKKSEIEKCLNIIIADKVALKENEEIDSIEYGNGKIKNILLLHNIQTMLNNKKAKSRFPFDRYKTDKWDIEHIHAIATEVKVKPENQKEWLSQNFVKGDQHKDDELNTQIERIKNNNPEPLSDEDFQKIISYVLGEEDNGIQNLCLLDRGTNRSYKNDSFKKKRKKIIANEKTGTFIPVCTRNVFMKYYSKDLEDLELWNEKDRISYIEDINETLRTISTIRLNQIVSICNKNKEQ